MEINTGDMIFEADLVGGGRWDLCIGIGTIKGTVAGSLTSFDVKNLIELIVYELPGTMFLPGFLHLCSAYMRDGRLTISLQESKKDPHSLKITTHMTEEQTQEFYLLLQEATPTAIKEY